MKLVNSSLCPIFPVLFLSLLCFLLSISTPALARDAVSIEDAVRTALKNNPDVRMAAINAKRARAELQKAESPFMPSLSLQAGYTRADAPSTYLFKTIDQRQLSDNFRDFNDPGTLTNYEAGINLRWNLFKGGEKFHTRAMSEAGIGEQKAVLSKAREMITASVIELYFSILKAQQFIEIAEKSVKTVQKQLEIMQAKYRAGGVLKSDILSLEVRLAESENSLVESRNLFETAVTSFETVLDKEFHGTLRLEKDCKCPVAFPDQAGRAVEQALDTRAEIRAAEKRVEKARSALRAARADYLPRVDINARYYMDDDDMSFNTEKENYMAALTMEWKLFSGFSTDAEIKKARYELQRALEAKKKASLAVKSEVKKAYFNYKNASARFDTAEKSVQSARQSLVIVKKRYEGGSEPVTRYLEAELARKRALFNKAAAYYDMKLAKSRIGKAMGILSGLWK
ncbi:MAG: TolC family protein [Desulfarculaceae bacterium]|nr:TolC family protein [Desulfarculaceae bacterium]